MTYHREEIPAEDLDLKSKEKVRQARDLRPEDADFAPEPSTRPELAFSGDNLSEKSYEPNNQQFVDNKEFGRVDNYINQGQQVVNELTKSSNEDKIQLKSDSLELDDLVKTVNSNTEKDLYDLSEMHRYNLERRENEIIKDTPNIQEKSSFPDKPEKVYSNRVLHHTQAEFSEKTKTDNLRERQNQNYDRNSINDSISEQNLEKEISDYTKKPYEPLDLNKRSFDGGFNFDKNKAETTIETEKKEKDFFGIKKKKRDLEILSTKQTRKEKIEFILDLVKNDGAQYGVKIAEKTRDWYILDAVHDKLHSIGKK